MIKVKRNPNFREWLQISYFGNLIDEVRRQSQALDIAKKASYEKGSDQIHFLGKVIKLKNK